MSKLKLVMLAAGGTGGHMFPALALARELMKRGFSISMISDPRGASFPGVADQTRVFEIPSSTPSRGGLSSRLRFLGEVYTGVKAAQQILKEQNPCALVGFGGYPALPATLAARRLRIPFCLHEQNTLLGRANRLVAGKARAIATSFEYTGRLPRNTRVVVTGNPVRQEIVALRNEPYPEINDDSLIRLLVVGGSQGASILSDVVPGAIGLLPASLRNRLQVTQQCRPEDVNRVRDAYASYGVATEALEFIDDMPERLRWSSLIISRAGATSIAEQTVAGRPSILVPLPGAMDDHQTANARVLADAGAGWLMPQPEFSPANLAKLLLRLANDPAGLKTAAAAACDLGRPRAALELADLIEQQVVQSTTAKASMSDNSEVGGEFAERRVFA